MATDDQRLRIVFSDQPSRKPAMHAKQLIREDLELADTTTVMLLEGLSDQEMLVRGTGGQSCQPDVGPSRR